MGSPSLDRGAQRQALYEAERARLQAQKKRRTRIIVIIAIVVVVVIVACAAKMVLGNTGSATGQTDAASTQATSSTAGNATDAVTSNTATTADTNTTATAATTTADDRSSFAVDPNNVPGTDSVTSNEKVFYLTIDDGPSELTPEFLDVLDKYNVKATFFVTAQDPSSFQYIKEAYDRGHTIGLHTYTHDYPTVYASDDAYFQDLDAIGQVVKDQIGYVPCFIRFPGGSSNTISANYSAGIMSRLATEVHEQGYQYYDWTTSAGDGSDHTTDEIIGYSTEGEETEYNTIVYLCHDSAGKRTTLEALPAIIEHYQALGYEFRALDRTSYTAHHGISN